MSNTVYTSPKFKEKLLQFKGSYTKNPSSLLAVFDFDFTMTQKYTYKPVCNDECHNTCYRLFCLGKIGNKKDISKNCDALNDKYSVYENDKSIDFKKREELLFEWYCNSLNQIISTEFTRSEITELINNNPDYYIFRPKLIECLKQLLLMNVPIIIISGGIEEVIIDLLRRHFNDIEQLMSKDKIRIISNKFIYDKNTGKVIAYDPNVVFTVNKDAFLKSLVKSTFPSASKLFSFGDNYADYDCVLNILQGQKDNLIGYGFLNFLPSKFGTAENKAKEEESIARYREVFDVVQLNDSGFEVAVENLRFVNGEISEIMGE